MYRYLPVFLLAVCTGCVSTSNLFQDGHTTGKGEWNAAFSASYNFVPEYDTDSVSRSVTLKPYRLPAPWLQFQGQYGLSERWDVGGSLGFGLLSFGLQGFSKFALTPNTSKLGVSLFGLMGWSGLDDKVSSDGERANYYNFLLGIPMSYQLAEKHAMVLQPMLQWDNYNYHIPDSGGAYRGDQHTKVYKLGVGYIHTNRKLNRVHFNMALNYYEVKKQVMPTFGISIHPAKD